MNPSEPPSFPRATAAFAVHPTQRIGGVLAGAGIITWIGDVLLWKASPGVSLGVFSCVIATAICVASGSASRTRAVFAALLLLAASCVQTAIDVCFSNVVVVTALLLFLLGHVFYGALETTWLKVCEAMLAVMRAPARWIWLGMAFSESELASVRFDTAASDRLSRSLQVLAPAACLVVVFGVIFSFGNAVFGELLSRASRDVARWIVAFDFSLARLGFWLLLSTIALVTLRPPPALEGKRWWAQRIEPWSRSHERVARWQSVAVLVTMNAMFFVVNTIDAIYLWRGAALPADVTLSQFVHHGVYSLIGAVLLAAAVLAASFQQVEAVSGSRTLKALATTWIAQNFVLIGGVLQRLRLYVDAYDLSELRVFVGCFLLLVGTGFVLLARHVLRPGNLNRLLRHNAVATFALFFTVQFCDVGGWVARANVARWQSEPLRTIDVEYLGTLGPGAWPSLVALAEQSRSGSIAVASRRVLADLAEVERARLENFDRRAWQARRDLRVGWMVAQADRLPPR